MLAITVAVTDPWAPSSTGVFWAHRLRRPTIRTRGVIVTAAFTSSRW